ncbi:MAG TPA: hypothetical protein VN428_03420 [Bryobacteraceae bacterium]|nr:hypothetical protein [Bryobacteraceae bacterium]
MNGTAANRIKHLGAILLGAVTLTGAHSEPARSLYCSACQFLEYYQALQDSKEIPAGFLERVRISIALAKLDAEKPQADGTGGRCSL